MAKTKSYQQIQRQIAQLQAQADRLRRAEVAGVVARIREAIDVYGLTAADLGFDASSPAPDAPDAPRVRRRRAAVNPFKAKAREARYRDTEGNTWGGVGKRPQWLRDKLEAGHRLEEFRIEPGT